MRLLGIDFGSKRIGLALTDEAGVMAFPHSVVSNDAHALKTIAGVIDAEDVAEVVVGLSKDYKGEENPIMKEAREFVDELKAQKDIPVHFEPEVLSTIEATHIQGRHDKTDASAATIILNSFIERKKHLSR